MSGVRPAEGRPHSWMVDFGTPRYPAVSRNVKIARATRRSSGFSRFSVDPRCAVAIRPWCSPTLPVDPTRRDGVERSVGARALPDPKSRRAWGEYGSGSRDGSLRVDARLVFELVDDVPVAAEREPGVVSELASDVDDASALVQE